ncbi:MAG: non-hydrolyzing UDP-N-acetylglucosamine 2-epimerase [Sphingomicrobium sp.]
MRFADIRLVIGTRPEAIKLRPVARALSAHGVMPTLVLTGQHALDPAEFRLAEFPRVTVDCPGQENPHAHVRAVTFALQPLLRDSPDLIIVQGDTSSALGAALAAFTTGIPVAHVEAGLRTHDPMLPWPEEEYRAAIDADADLLFAPTDLAAANLREEQVAGEIHVTGNTAVDSVVEVLAQLPPRVSSERPSPQILVTCHRRESWRDGLGSIASAVAELGQRAAVHVVLHPNRHVAATMRRLLDGSPGVTLLEPCSHQELLRRMRDADLLLSDSGGIQEEAPTLGVPLLVLRDKTERPEGVAAGNAILVGTDRDRIVAEAQRLLDDPAARAAMSRRAFPFGDGRAGDRIASIIVEWLQQRSLTRQLA